MPQFHLPSLEEEQLKQWKEHRILDRLLAREDHPAGNFVFFEGPPTANGKPGIHHMLARIFKDVILRFRTMQGYKVDRKAGWDTHGLPVELEVEKQLGFTKKQDIEEYGVAAFNAKCRESVWTYLDLWQKSTERSAFWVDLQNPYITYKNEYVESLWSILKQIDQKELLYKGYRVTPHCPRCVTSLSSHELAQGYDDVEDPSVYVKFKIDDNRFFLVWTTTPWTLPGNVALAVGSGVDYVEVKINTGEIFILAKERLSVLGEEFEVLREIKGSELVGKGYEALYEPSGEFRVESGEKMYKVYAADFVSTSDGTGIVHIAPAFGEDDSKLGNANELPTLLTVDITGTIITDAPGKGKFFKKADEDIQTDLASRGLLYRAEKVTHSYPFCWRCNTPILYYAKSSWYIRMSSLREKLLAMNDQINWVPGHIKEGRFGEWLKEVKDWALSRERYWGTPLPVWECQACNEHVTVGSLEELEERRLPQNVYYLQRHGEGEQNVAGTLSSWPEIKAPHLTEKGKTQVQKAARELKAKGVDMIFASDLQRTTETAEIIASELGLSIVYDERLRELDVGVFNGKTEKEFHAQFAEKDDRFEKPSEGGESLNDVRKRMVSFLKEMESTYAGKRILIVSHGDPLWMLQTAFLGLSNQQMLDWPHYNHVGEFKEIMSPKNAPYDEMGNIDVHRPFIDDVRLECKSCKGEMRRVKDLIDVWFDSGAMPFAQWHYPFENTNRIEGNQNFPADYISEGIDQTRGWFYTLLAISACLDTGVPPYKNVICLGHVLDAKGKKMSKSKGNVIDPFVAMDTWGADAVRHYFFTLNQPGEPKRFDPRGVEDVVKKVFLILWNVQTFYKMFARENGEIKKDDLHVMDKWILSELSELQKTVTRGLCSYDPVTAARAIGDFITDLSTWYIRRSRDRFKNKETQESAIATLQKVLLSLAKLMAPFTPFFADALYKQIGGKEDSVHLDHWDNEINERDESLSRAMHEVRRAASLGLEQRAASSMPVRQALASATIISQVQLEDWSIQILKEELNVHEVLWEKGEVMQVKLDTVLTPALKREGAAREFVRQVNDARKSMKLTIQDRIVVTVYGKNTFWEEVLNEYNKKITEDALADKVVFGEEKEESSEFESHGERIAFSIRKV